MKQIKTIKGLAKELCLREGKKKQVNIAQMSETLGHLSDITYEQIQLGYSIATILYKNSKKRAKKKAKSCRK